MPTNVFVDNKLHCPVCSGRQVQKGINDLWTTHPDLAARLLDKEDGFRYSFGSNKKLKWLCPECGDISVRNLNKMVTNLSLCQKCSKIRSYGEKFVIEFLNQLSEYFECEKIFDWSDSKRYDFYLPLYNMIIEVNGKQHYGVSDFSYCGGRSYIEEQLNDQYKKDLAIQNGIQYYIVIDCSNSNNNFLADNILKSLLPTILDFKKYDIDWDKCHEFSTTNKTKMICDYYEKKEKDLDEIAEHFNCCRNTIRNHLINGAKIGLCSYNPIESRIETNLRNGKRIVDTMSKPVAQFDLDGNFINKYSGIQQAQRETGYSHIWDCICGRNKTSGGYQWKYVDNCNDVKPVFYNKCGKPFKSVNQYDIDMNLIKIWNSISEASKEIGIKGTGIINVCKGKQKTAGGYIWRYN